MIVGDVDTTVEDVSGIKHSRASRCSDSFDAILVVMD